MNAEVIATIQCKLLLYKDEADWLKNIIRAHQAESDIDKSMCENLIAELNKLNDIEVNL